jgi:hypothetical protein
MYARYRTQIEVIRWMPHRAPPIGQNLQLATSDPASRSMFDRVQCALRRLLMLEVSEHVAPAALCSPMRATMPRRSSRGVAWLAESVIRKRPGSHVWRGSFLGLGHAQAAPCDFSSSHVESANHESCGIQRPSGNVRGRSTRKSLSRAASALSSAAIGTVPVQACQRSPAAQSSPENVGQNPPFLSVA